MYERLTRPLLLLLALSFGPPACGDDGGSAGDAGATDVGLQGDGDGGQTLADGSAGACDPAATPFGGGVGSEADPYLVCAPGHWGALGVDADVHYLLTRDLDFEGQTYTPIADFRGVLSGAGHAVRNVDCVGDEGAALFLRLDRATLRDLRVADIAVRAQLRAAVIALDGCAPVGGAGGRCTIERVHVTGATVSADASSVTDDPSAHAAGLFVTASLATIEDVSFEGHVAGDVAAGAIYATQQQTQLRRVRVDASVEGTEEASGLVGSVVGSRIEGAAVSGTATGGRRVSGIFGALSYLGGPEVSDVYSTMSLTLSFGGQIPDAAVGEASYRIAGAVATPRFGSGRPGSLSRFYFGGTIAVPARPPWVTAGSEVVTAGLFACWGGYTGCAGAWIGAGCYWDAEASGQAVAGHGLDDCPGLSSAELRTPAATPELLAPTWVKTDGALPALAFE